MEKILNENDLSYLIGLFQTDGNLHETTRNRGKFRLELNIKDEDIIHKISKLIKYNFKISSRERETNFGKSSTIMLSVYNIEFREFLKKSGVPAGKKSEIIKPPIHINKFSPTDYIRGLYDGDGSLGYTSTNFPYVSFTTQSEFVKNFLIDYISEITFKNKKELTKNVRDNIYNIMITKEDAIMFCEKIYPENCLSINRKYKSAQEIKKWKRPSGMIKIENKKTWNKEDDLFIVTHSIVESMEELDRTESSIKNRLWRLKPTL
jgi:hypothetical protein